MEPKMEPCPFCGSAAFEPLEHPGIAATRCSNTDCDACNLAVYLSDWNTRPLESALRAALSSAAKEIEALKAKLGEASATLAWAGGSAAGIECAALNATATCESLRATIARLEAERDAAGIERDFLTRLRDVNVRRCREGFKHELADWTALEWAGAAAGEMGEAANVAKKMRRSEYQKKINGNPPDETLRAMLAAEIADTITYLDLLAAREGIDLAEAVASAFNKVSERIGWTEQLHAEPPRAAAAEEKAT